MQKAKKNTPNLSAAHTHRIPVSHLSRSSKVARDMKSGRAFPLNEDAMVRGDGSPESIHKIVDYLDVEKSDRYKRTKTSTYCNIYAHDFAYLMGKFLPRVFWTSDAIKNKKWSVKYGDTVRELNANSLYEWFDDYGLNYGWSKVDSEGDAQEFANAGKCVIMVAANKNRRRSGHIVVVVPESETIPIHALIQNGVITCPAQSQAGGTNRKYFARKWWGNMEELRIYVCE